ncbi:MAG: hypothetical protein SCH39_00910 [Methanosarcinales archaeon]|nr:hypothetical protein [Methanosarcinales archaeon]
MSTKHNNEPRNVGYSKHHAQYFQDQEAWINKESNTIFAGKKQRDLFIFAMALGKFKESNSGLKDKQANIPVDAISEQQKWALLSIGITECNELICLKDEGALYEEAEKYAEEGLKILKSHMDKWTINYSKALAADLKEILDES